MLSDGLWLMVIGMTVVFIFLGLLVKTIEATSILLRKLPGAGLADAPSSGRKTRPQKQGNEEIAVIMASLADRSRKGSR